MRDGHIHLERGPYTKAWLDQFVDQALERGIKTLYILEHSHRFKDFKSLYQGLDGNPYQKSWLSRKFNQSLRDYQTFIRQMRQEVFPVEIKFGLEICYFRDQEDFIREIKEAFDWDFLTGSIHWIDKWGFDHEDNRATWLSKDVDQVYKAYYDLLADLIRSGLFDHVGHPDSLKCFGHYPSGSLTETYHKIADLARAEGLVMEHSGGLYNNYQHPSLGLNQEFLSILQDHGVEIITASDAHCPEDVGLSVKALQADLEGLRTYQTVLGVAMEQTCRDLDCKREDLVDGGYHLGVFGANPMAKTCFKEEATCSLVSYGQGLVVATKEDLIDKVDMLLDRSDYFRNFEPDQMEKINDLLRPYKKKMAYMTQFFLPDPQAHVLTNSDLDIRVFEGEAIRSLYKDQSFTMALEYKLEGDKKDVLAIGAYKHGRLVGLAGASSDCQAMWQVGIDVLAEHRGEGIAISLIHHISKMILKKGIVPYYGCAWSNLPSIRTALKAGYKLAWTELSAGNLS